MPPSQMASFDCSCTCSFQGVPAAGRTDDRPGAPSSSRAVFSFLSGAAVSASDSTAGGTSFCTGRADSGSISMLVVGLLLDMLLEMQNCLS